MTAILGYARVNTTGKDLDAQLAELTVAGVDPGQIFTDKLSGRPTLPGRDWLVCSTMPVPAIRWSSRRSTGSAARSKRSPAP